MTHGLVLGKFLPYHAGHAHLIRSARARVDHLTVLVCSIAREPIPGGLRYQWVRRSHPDCDVRWVNEEVPQAPEESVAFWPTWTELIARHAGPVDVVFTSEAYGDELAHRIGARHECVDLERAAFPVSGTAVRADPMTNWRFLPPVVRPHFVRRVALVGAESTGKTTLAARLADAFGTTWVPEFGRPFCEGRDPLALTTADFDAIGWGQATWEDDAAERATRLLVCDTDLLTTVTWSEIVTGARPPLLAAAASARRHALVLLLSHEGVPWIQDGTRVLEDRRAEHTRRLRRELDAAGQPYRVIGGDFAARFAQARAHIERTVLRAASVPSPDATDATE